MHRNVVIREKCKPRVKPAKDVIYAGKRSKPTTINKVNAPPKPGIYIIMNLKRLHRIGGIDPKGILYVGKSGNLQKRLDRFLECPTPS